MKRILLYFGLVLALGIGVSSCYKDIIKPDLPKDPNAPPQQVSFANELKPLFAASCTDVGCHVSGAHKPYLTADVSYNEIVNGGFINLQLPTQSILIKLLNGDMQQYMPSADNRQKVLDWIRNGAPNN
ncbi:MAG TPA: hypothetical protein PLU37_02880 [Chitinophagaceae bacterium]|nr:hypothetical protein [Chitinophagales bacterium]HPG10446.1 hypothetical protein [Chitinophagaceae bacterium]